MLYGNIIAGYDVSVNYFALLMHAYSPNYKGSWANHKVQDSLSYNSRSRLALALSKADPVLKQAGTLF